MVTGQALGLEDVFNPHGPPKEGSQLCHIVASIQPANCSHSSDALQWQLLHQEVEQTDSIDDDGIVHGGESIRIHCVRKDRVFDQQLRDNGMIWGRIVSAMLPAHWSLKIMQVV